LDPDAYESGRSALLVGGRDRRVVVVVAGLPRVEASQSVPDTPTYVGGYRFMDAGWEVAQRFDNAL